LVLPNVQSICEKNIDGINLLFNNKKNMTISTTRPFFRRPGNCGKNEATRPFSSNYSVSARVTDNTKNVAKLQIRHARVSKYFCRQACDIHRFPVPQNKKRAKCLAMRVFSEAWR